MLRSKWVLGLISLICMTVLAPNVVAQDADVKFQAWLEDLRVEARGKGISEETIVTALSNVTLRPKIIQRDRNQPEIKQIYASYFKSRISEWRIKKGGEMLREHADLFKEIGDTYGVAPRYVAAIWGMETNYGTFDLTINVFDALATLAYDPRRGKRFRGELFSALEILEKGHASMDQMMGSWAGAMGQPQFMPVNYLNHSVDHDGDGKRDIWTSKADVFASIASYLKHYGWQEGRIWGRPVELPDGGEASLPIIATNGEEPSRFCKKYKSMGKWRKLNDWNSLGVRRMNGGDLPEVDIAAALVIGDPGDDRGYLVYNNFCSIMLYNPAFKYALGVGMLGDKIQAAAEQN